VSWRPEVLEIDREECDAILVELKPRVEERLYEKIAAILRTLLWVLDELRAKRVAIRRLKRILFGVKTERTSKVTSGSETTSDPKAPGADAPSGEPDSDKPPGHGRHGADAYPGAEEVFVALDGLSAGDPCPRPPCRGKLYRNRPRVIVRITGQPPIRGTVTKLESVRCNACGEVFTADAPADLGTQKYDETAAAMIGVLKYGSGFPFKRMERLEGHLGIALPASTQWDVVERASRLLEPAFEELVRQAAQGELLHNDDTGMKILSRMKALEDADDEGRTGTFTTGIVSILGDRQIALFVTGAQHAGENLADVLRQRASGLPPPIQMSDALSRNLPGELETIVANCNAHARRHFVDVVSSFPEESRYVLEAFKEVYGVDAKAKKEELSPEDRLALHHDESQPVMDELHAWSRAQLEENKVEPNSGLGGAITYLLKHWTKLTLFLRVPGAPLDNSVCERALKKAVLHRKNSYCYKTENGARVGDLYMSLIYTAELAGASPFDYLVELQRHADRVREDPAAWMPWNYRETLAVLDQATAA